MDSESEQGFDGVGEAHLLSEREGIGEMLPRFTPILFEALQHRPETWGA